MLKSATKILGITIGDPAGIGIEVTAKALKNKNRPNVHLVLIGDKKLIKKYLPNNLRGISFYDVPFKGKLIPGVPSKETGQAALNYLDLSVRMIKHGLIDGVVTAPLSKEWVAKTSRNFVGHTEYLAQAFNVRHFDMMFVARKMRLVIATRHEPLIKVPSLITKSCVLNAIILMHATLQKQFKILNPNIAVLGLNPHAGEGGLLGKEDIKHIVPAIYQAKKKGIKVAGPFAADTFFINYEQKGFDGVIAMYHDQGLIPVKTMYFKEVVNLTSGLPFIRTSPAHGTGFDIAGKNIADHHSMSCAIDLACSLL